jgi:hypothetical protein
LTYFDSDLALKVSSSSTLVECTIDFIYLHKELSPLNRTVTLQLPAIAVVVIVLVCGIDLGRSGSRLIGAIEYETKRPSKSQ